MEQGCRSLLKIILSLGSPYSVLDELFDLLVDICALFSLFLSFISLHLLLLFFMLFLSGFGQSSLVFLFLLLDVLLNFGFVVLFLLLDLFSPNLTHVSNALTVVSHTLLVECNRVLVVSDILSVIIVIVELNKLVATLILFLGIGPLHSFICLLLILHHNISLVL